MKTRFLNLLLLTSLTVVFTTVAVAEPGHESSQRPAPAKGQDVNNPAFHKTLLDIAGEYKQYGQVDDIARIAPALCAMATPMPLPKPSKSTDTATHGGKTYFLFAKDRAAYQNTEAPVGQVIVKEAWIPDAQKSAAPDAPQQFGIQKKPGIGTKHGLFIMTRLDPKVPNTDDGWIYGTVTADGKTVTSSGRVQSCMNCHVAAPHGRLFGIEDPSKKPPVGF